MRHAYDIVVAGCGVAGVAAAVSAASGGAKVAVLERSPREVRGGNSRYTDATMRLKNEEGEVTDDFEGLLAAPSEQFVPPDLLSELGQPYEKWPSLVRSHHITDPAMIHAFADNVPVTIQWLRSFGIRLIPGSTAHLTESTPSRFMPVGGGQAIVETLADVAEQKGVVFHYETTAQRLLMDDDGHVVGVYASSRTHGGSEFAARAVILASGGFEGNYEMLTRYFGGPGYLLRPVCRGGWYNKGEGIRMALDIGAAPAGQFDGCHSTVIDPRSARTLPAVYLFPYGILVNERGGRFVDEGGGLSDDLIDGVSKAIWRQPNGRAFLILDSKIKDIANYEKGVHSEMPPIEASSIEQLATRIGIAPPALRTTIETFNAAVQEGTFDPLRLDGKCTAGIEPRKSNWARPIEGPKLKAYPVVAGIVFTHGGVKVNPHAQVVDLDGEEVPGLYAAGEVVGLYYRDYVSSTSVLRGLVFGRLAGEHAARSLQRARA